MTHRPDQRDPDTTDRTRERLLEALPALPATEASWSRIEARVAILAGKRRQRRRVRRVGSGILLGLTVVLVSLNWPLLAGAHAIHRAAGALEQVRSVHLVTREVTSEGVTRIESETWFQDGSWRIENGGEGSVQIYANGRLWIYNEADDQMTVRTQSSPFGHHLHSFLFDDVLRHLRHTWSPKARARLGRKADGLQEVVVDAPNGNERVLLLLDVESHLPNRVVLQAAEGPAWRTLSVTEFRFGGQPPPNAFEPKSPGSARVVDLDLEREKWRRKLAQPLIRDTYGGHSIALRDVQVNMAGEVFILFTAGQDPEDDTRPVERVELSDDLGTVYIPGPPVHAYARSASTDNFWPGLVIDGERLEAVWWVPVVGLSQWQPRDLEFRFHLAGAGPHNARILRWNIPAPTVPLVPPYDVILPATSLTTDDILRARDAVRSAH
jgi:hypothetical protein